MSTRKNIRQGATLVIALAFVAPCVAADECTFVQGPDVVVGDLYEAQRWGGKDGRSAYSVGTESCNLGDEPLPWFAFSSDHPVIAQQMYRFHEGRFEQIGMSWVKHGFSALSMNLCCSNCQATGDDTLGVGCSDPYSSFLNGDQGGFFLGGGLGPRSEVNAATGSFPFPYSWQGVTGDVLYKRLQVRDDDVRPEANPGARYFVEAQYVTAADAAAGWNDNNVSFREAFVDSNLQLVLTGATQPAQPAIQAWPLLEAGVELHHLDIPGDGRMILGTKVTDRGDGTWHYEYALYNMTSHRSGQSFRIPIPPGVTVTNVGFHDVDYHSGEPFDPTDWPASVPGSAGGVLSWSTAAFAENANANALRWGTLYNFRFDADAPPEPVTGGLALFRPGAPNAVPFPTSAPASGCGGPRELFLSQQPVIRGETVRLQAMGAAAGETVVFILGRAGQGCEICPEQLGGSCLDLVPPVRVLGEVTADAGGTAVLSVPVPPGAPAGSASAQAVVRRGALSAKSNAVTAPVLDP